LPAQESTSSIRREFSPIHVQRLTLCALLLLLVVIKTVVLLQPLMSPLSFLPLLPKLLSRACLTTP
jgi:competence protein ComGF